METETQEGYICIPKEIFIDGEYNLLTAEAKLMYGILLDRRRLYEINEWYCDDGCIYVCCTIDEAMKHSVAKRGRRLTDRQKQHIKQQAQLLISSNVSMREAAKLLNVDRQTLQKLL